MLCWLLLSSTHWRNSTLSLHNTGSHLSPSQLSELHLILPFNQFITWKMCELNTSASIAAVFRARRSPRWTIAPHLLCYLSGFLFRWLCQDCSVLAAPPAPPLLIVSHARRHVLWLPRWQPFHYSQEHNCFITREGVSWRMALKLPLQWLQFNGRFFTLNVGVKNGAEDPSCSSADTQSRTREGGNLTCWGSSWLLCKGDTGKHAVSRNDSTCCFNQA